MNGELNKFLSQISKNNNQSNKNTFKYIEHILLQSIKNDEIFLNAISTQKDLKNFIYSFLNDLPQINDSYINLINKFLYGN